MKLSIVITRYNESDEIVRQLLDSIQMQRGVNLGDIEALMVYDREEDATDVIPLKSYSFPIRMYHQKHNGVSSARNLGLDKSFGDYVMFCDADDMFINAYGLHLIFQNIENGYDLITSAFVEEQPIGDKLNLVRHEHDATFVHGKVYKREYLTRENIRFDESLSIHEDGYFNSLAYLLTENKYEISTPFYCWKWNPNSVVRTNSKNFTLNTYGHLMTSRYNVCEQLEKRELPDVLIAIVVKTICDTYFDFNKPEFLATENNHEMRLAKQSFAFFYKRFNEYYLEANINDIASQMNISRMLAVKNGFLLEQFTLKEFLTEMIKDI